MIKSLFTAEQVEDLKKEFVEFYINDMTTEQMADWIRVVYLGELNKCTEDEVREEIDRYDENLYEVLAPYVLDEDEMEWIGQLRDKVESIMQMQTQYDMETV